MARRRAKRVSFFSGASREVRRGMLRLRPDGVWSLSSRCGSKTVEPQLSLPPLFPPLGRLVISNWMIPVPCDPLRVIFSALAYSKRRGWHSRICLSSSHAVLIP
ncbi:hypothetical protein IEQ34_016762 [Dendrobium chrysotoxum]|uniref:Uncharacterized protein n=1 Tax=Dendrobium chrysotoxum TaxID=161865 RepID=A0AAV7GGK0_DENCH|nr:hypothetical protein IEQ34_016762 [Dendrobium chrysotoxum]